MQTCESRIRSSDAEILVGSDRANARRLGQSFNMVELNSRANVHWLRRRRRCAVNTRAETLRAF